MSSILAFLSLIGVWLLAFSGAVKPTPADKTALFFLAAAFLVALIPKFHRRLAQDANAATFAFLAAFFVLFQIADRAGPDAGLGITLPILPDDKFVFSYATYVVVIGALASAGAWWKPQNRGGPVPAILAGLALVAVLGLGSFWLLGRFYEVGADQTLDPRPIPTLVIQAVTYGCLALVCRAAAAPEWLRRLVLKLLPAGLLILWARHYFIAPPVEKDEE